MAIHLNTLTLYLFENSSVNRHLGRFLQKFWIQTDLHNGFSIQTSDCPKILYSSTTLVLGVPQSTPVGPHHFMRGKFFNFVPINDNPWESKTALLREHQSILDRILYTGPNFDMAP